MNKKAQWILTEQEVANIQRHRLTRYKQIAYPQVDHTAFNRGYIQEFVKFVRDRKRKHPAEYPFKFQKIVYYAVALYKRYYLINSYICEDFSYPQAMLCSFYLSLKYNQYDEDFMLKMASKWKNKPFFNHLQKRLPHYGDQEYTHNELTFLSGIKFQTGVSKVITPIESMYHIIMKGRNTFQQIAGHSDKQQDILGIRESIFDLLTFLYRHPTLIFLFEGPKLALSIVYCVLKQKKVPYQNLGQDFVKIIEQNLVEIEQIIQILEQEKLITDVSQKYEYQQSKMVTYQKFVKPLNKSQQTPKLQPRHDFVLEAE